MLTYKIEWEKDGKIGSFTVTAQTDEACIQAGHEQVEEAGGEVLDYYQIDPNPTSFIKALANILAAR